VTDRIDSLRRELGDLEMRMGDPELTRDPERLADAGRRYVELKAIVEVADEIDARTEDLAAAKELLTDAPASERDAMRGEVTSAEADIERLEAELRLLMLPKDPNDDKNVIVEIRGAEGGEEANLWARDLFEMYRSFAANQGWKFETLNTDASDMGGYNEVTFKVSGEGVWSRMKHEGGPHRVQRVPATESQGRIHTSSAAVSVLPEADEVDVSINDADLQIDVYRSSGPGGQSVNTTDSAVRITHLPTGLVVSMQDEKSQLQNRARALVVLRSRLLKAEQDRLAAERSESVREQVGGGGRSEKIRTYNFKENRVSDHRIGLTLYRLDKVLAGDLDEISDALVADEQTRRLEEG
jgi:peptide chain release factor 1